MLRGMDVRRALLGSIDQDEGNGSHPMMLFVCSWIYAARDENYSETVTRTFFGKFRETGGTGPFVFVTEHSLGSGHAVAKDPKLWEGEVREYLKGLR